MKIESIKDIVSYYATPSYDSVEVEEDKNWSIDDLLSLQSAVTVELQKRMIDKLIKENNSLEVVSNA